MRFETSSSAADSRSPLYLRTYFSALLAPFRSLLTRHPNKQMTRALFFLRRAAHSRFMTPTVSRANHALCVSTTGTTRKYASRAFLLEDSGVGIPESERLSDLSTAARWRYAREAAEMAKEREFEKAADGMKQGTATQRTYSMAPVRAFYDRATPRKDAKRKNWPDTPGGESLMEPVWTVYGNFKAFGGC